MARVGYVAVSGLRSAVLLAAMNGGDRDNPKV